MKKNVLLALVSVTLTVLLTESCIRLFIPQSDRFYRADENLGSILKPNYRGWWYGEYVSNREFANKVTTNSFGFHDVEHPLYNRATSRVVLLGDSYLEALQVPLEKTVARVLERELNQSETRWEVIALGRAGASTAEEIVLWEEWGSRFKPDYAAIIFSQNDLLENERLTPETQGRPRFWGDDGRLKRLPPIIEVQNDTTSFIADHSHLVRFLIRFSFQQEKRSELARRAYEAELGSVELSLTPQLLEILLEKIEAAGSTPLVIFVDDDPQTNSLLEPIIRLLDAHGVKYMAMGDKQVPSNQQYYFPFDGHLNAKGHARLAALIAAVLLD